MKTHLHKLWFFAGLVVLPVAVGVFQVRPALERRQAALERQQKAGAIQARNHRLPAQRDELRAAWESFRPQAERTLAGLENDLNPNLVLKRIHSLAEEHGCEARVTLMPQRDDGPFVRVALNGEGRWADAVALIDALEQGAHYCRFEKLRLTFPRNEARSRERRLTFNGVILIPLDPEHVEDKS